VQRSDGMKTIAELMAIIESLDVSNEPEWKQKVIADSITRFNEIISDDYEMLEEGETKESLAEKEVNSILSWVTPVPPDPYKVRLANIRFLISTGLTEEEAIYKLDNPDVVEE
jgi:hypothetical protein